jgi:hypothetical protein
LGTDLGHRSWGSWGAINYDISNANLASGLFDCPVGQIARETAGNIVNYATTAVLEENLACRTSKPFEGIKAKFPDTIEYQEQL